MNAVSSCINSFHNFEEMITRFKIKNHKSEKEYKNYIILSTILESVDTVVILGATSTSENLSITGTGLIFLPIKAGIAYKLSPGKKTIHKLITNKYNKDKNQYEKDRQTIKSFEELCKRSLQDDLIGRNEYEPLCNFFTKFLVEINNESFS